jgi:competence protein ComEA
MHRVVGLVRSLLGISESGDDAPRVRWKIGLGASVVVGLAAISVAILASTLTSWGQTSSVPEELRAPTSSPGGPTPPASKTTLVHVVGAVVNPGMYELAPDARVIDATMAAGGMTATAASCALNLARPVNDGEQILVPEGDPSANCQAQQLQQSATASSPVSLNQATVAQLDSLPGIGPALAQRIIDWRAQHGSFTSVDQLGGIEGIGDKLFAKLRDRVAL